MASPFPPPPSSKHSPPADEASGGGDSSSFPVSLNPSLFIISAIVAFVFCSSAFIHLLLRFLSARSRRSSSLPPMPPPLISQRRDHGSSSTSSSSATAAMLAGLSNRDKAALIDSLPLFTLAAFPKASPDCAVCLYPFRPHDELRLLPACRHAFHSQCLDPWLLSAPSCPLCRSSIALPAPPLPPPGPSRSGSYRVEIGSVSRRGAPMEAELAAGNPQPHLRTYTLGSSFEYVVDEEVSTVVELIYRRTEEEEKQEGVVTELASEAEATPPGAGVAEAAGGSGGGRGWWLRDYVDRLSSSLSSSSPLSSF